jgi:hypothetical protein
MVLAEVDHLFRNHLFRDHGCWDVESHPSNERPNEQTDKLKKATKEREKRKVDGSDDEYVWLVVCGRERDGAKARTSPLTGCMEPARNHF